MCQKVMVIKVVVFPMSSLIYGHNNHMITFKGLFGAVDLNAAVIGALCKFELFGEVKTVSFNIVAPFNSIVAQVKVVVSCVVRTLVNAGITQRIRLANSVSVSYKNHRVQPAIV